MHWIGSLMENNMAIGVIVLLGWIVLRVIERQVDKKSNGHFKESDREAAADRCARLDSVEKTVDGLATDFKDYAGRGHTAMTRIESVQKTVDEMGRRLYDQGERLATMASTAALSNQQVITALGIQNDASKSMITMLGEIRDQSIKQSGYLESLTRRKEV